MTIPSELYAHLARIRENLQHEVTRIDQLLALDGCPPLTAEEFELLKAGRFIDTVKAYRARLDCSLYQAKLACEAARLEKR